MAKGTEKVEGIRENVASAENAGDNRENVKENAAVWQVMVKNNPDFCGIGAGGVQFANGKAVIHSERMAQWFMEHSGYEVTRQ